MIVNNLVKRKSKINKAKILIFLTAIAFVSLKASTVIALPSNDLETPCLQFKVTAPSATTTNVIYISSTSAELVGNVNPNNDATKYWFEYNRVGFSKESTGFIYAGKDANSKYASLKVQDLIPNTEYSFNIVSSNNFGETYGKQLVFKTSNK